MKFVLSLLAVISLALFLSFTNVNGLQIHRNLKRISGGVSNEFLRAQVDAQTAEVQKMTNELVSQISKNLLGTEDVGLDLSEAGAGSAVPIPQAAPTAVPTAAAESSAAAPLTATAPAAESSAAAPSAAATSHSSESSVSFSSEESSAAGSSGKKTRLWSDFSYADQEDWPELCQIGRKQSPIAITLEKAKISVGGKEQFPVFNFGKGSGMNLVYNNFTYLLKDKKGSLGSVTFRGDEYHFRQFHFHHKSEHTINNKRFAAEIHLVYQKKNAAGADGLLNVGFLFDIEAGKRILSQDPSWSGDVFLNDLGLDQDNLPVWGHPVKLGEVNLGVFKHATKSHFYVYEGSLSTPPCTESSLWIVFPVAIPIRAEQLAPFKRFTRPPFPSSGNTRDTVPVHVEHDLTLVVLDRPEFHEEHENKQHSAEHDLVTSEHEKCTDATCRVKVVMKDCLETSECGHHKNLVETEVVDHLPRHLHKLHTSNGCETDPCDEVEPARRHGHAEVVTHHVEKGALSGHHHNNEIFEEHKEQTVHKDREERVAKSLQKIPKPFL